MEGLEVSCGEVALRLLVSVVLCGRVRLESEMRDQPARFTTPILLSLSAMLSTFVSAYDFEPFTAAAAAAGRSRITFDPTSITAQIVTDIGFLGARAIIRQ